ncbi:MAG: hypothetical protein QNJ31_06380 [Candidatus Caenarcaniphilales bacterium]|nr:hypothetical protein [Candidatus Caenarcaniphilales bacterium]
MKIKCYLFSSLLLLTLLLLLLNINTPVSSNSKKIFGSQSTQELLKESINLIGSLNVQKTNSRISQYLILKDKRVDLPIEPAFTIDYLTMSKPCLDNLDLCSENTQNKHFNNFYTKLRSENILDIKKSIKRLLEENNERNHKRAKFLNLAFKSLFLGVQEIDGPNDDSRTGGNLIKQYFEAAGLTKIDKELTDNKVDEWAWCAAFITALTNQAGSGFSFLTQDEYQTACKNMNKESHCHPVQVDFIVNWAYKKAHLNQNFSFTNLQEVTPGDLLALINPKNGQASHIGIYIGQSKECLNKQNECWLYTIEGNAGPFINDVLEQKWNEVDEIIERNKISIEDYERLLDRVTIVKRPINNWDLHLKIFN